MSRCTICGPWMACIHADANPICERCDETFSAADLSVEAFEAHDGLYCPACVDALNEAAWDRQQEALAAGEGPPSLAEQQRVAWAQKHGLPS